VTGGVGQVGPFLASVAGTLVILGLAIVAPGLAGYTPEAAPAGVFALFWAVICGTAAVASWRRETGNWVVNLSLRSLDLQIALSVGFALASLWALAVALTAPFYAASRVMILLPLALLTLSWLLVRYFSSIGPSDLPEAPALARWARVGIWQGALPALSELGRWWNPSGPWAAVVSWVTGLTILAAALDLSRANLEAWTQDVDRPLPLVDLTVIRLLGSRLNPLASMLDAAEDFLGVDLRGSWALRVVRQGAEPLAIAALFLGWLATSLTQVKVSEQGVVERFGRILPGAPLGPGLHLHLPWPIDQVRREPTARVLTIAVGHEGVEPAEPGPENVLWARQHESNEFMFLLGDGRDLVTIDGLMRYRIRDLRQYLTTTADTPALLRGLVYAAVTNRTVGRSLDQVLSENLEGLTHDIAVAVQADADVLGLGVEVIGMTVGGMHPPVVVAAEYEAVVSAQVGRETIVVGARTEAERDVPAAATAALVGVSKARADAGATIATAKGEAEAFRGARASLAADPALFQYRRRLEALEAGLSGRRIVILDDRLERDGATLWWTE